jgi:hypothetical protein
MAEPFWNVIDIPVKTNIMESVVSISDIPILIIKKALTQPTITPTIRGTIIAYVGPISQITIILAAMTDEKPAVAPTERSKPSIVKDKVIAKAINATIETDLKILVMLLKFIKLSNVNEK